MKVRLQLHINLLDAPLNHFSAQPLDRAHHLDSHLQQTGKPVGPLHGLPLTVKNTYCIKGIYSSIGLASLAFNPAQHNAVLVNLLVPLGAVIISKTVAPQTMVPLTQ
jgi:Asp-tRNA(Asn)/Glu-tRNA(Gln) amidotransferase A subunit family amidase